MVKQRAYYLDTVGGILLIHMMAGHCFQWSRMYGIYYSLTYFLNFFMPWFFFKAGMFYKQRSLREEACKSYNRLIIPYIFFTIIGVLLWVLKLTVYGEFSPGDLLVPFREILISGSASGNLALWFLLSLFIVRLLFSAIHHRMTDASGNRHKLLWGGCMILICCIFLPVHYFSGHIRYPLWLSNISSGMLFFVCGYLLRNYRPGRVAMCVSIAFYSILMFVYPTSVDMRTGTLIDGIYLLWVPTSLIGILAFNSFFHHCFDRANMFSYLGARTMPYYCMHWCVIVFISIFFPDTSNEPDITFLCTLLIANIIILPAATHMIGKTPYSYVIR